MENNSIRHEIVSSNPDIDVRFYLSEDSGSYVAPHWHNSLELVYMIEGSMVTQFENNVRQTLTYLLNIFHRQPQSDPFGDGAEKQGAGAADPQRCAGKVYSGI